VNLIIIIQFFISAQLSYPIPKIIVGIPPPNNDVMRDITIVFWMPVFGESPIMKANAMDSGINKSAIVRPERNSLMSNVGDADVTVFIFNI